MNELIIRADGNTAIGSGHIMRCLSIAQEMCIRDRCQIGKNYEKDFNHRGGA